ncbi:MAG: AmmeMemoRadiSam system protein B [Nanoarchaeota archaeon]|nr:AmmeMemoRadiSam system protein B [Nanoarchaeota archaeon]
MRKPIAADSFYAGDPLELSKQVMDFIIDVKGKGDVKIAIAPHAGYIYSGKCAGEVYSRIKWKPETVILIGPNHSGIGPSIAVSLQSFLTPLGKLEADLELVRMIIGNAKDDLDINENEGAHQFEHSLEVQLPFLQTVIKSEIKIVPIILKEMPYESCAKLAEIIFYSIKNLKRKVLVIVSSDFTHYGNTYGFAPFVKNVREELYKIDEKAIDFILQLNSRDFYDYARKNTTICGFLAITAGIELAKLMQCKEAEKVCFYTSGDVTKDYENSVNYAGIVFR